MFFAFRRFRLSEIGVEIEDKSDDNEPFVEALTCVDVLFIPTDFKTFHQNFIEQHLELRLTHFQFGMSPNHKRSIQILFLCNFLLL